MSGSLVEDALEMFNARMDAAAGVGVDVPPERRALVMSGLDLDLDAAQARMHTLAHSILLATVLSSSPPCEVLTDALVQAMAVGVLHERTRAERDRVAGP